MYLFIYLFYLFIYLFINLFIYLFIYLFIIIKFVAIEDVINFLSLARDNYFVFVKL